MMFHLRMINALMILSLGSVAVAGEVYAVPSPTDVAGNVNAAAAKLKPAAEVENSTKTDSGRIAPVDTQADVDPQESLPMQANIVVWREANISAPNNIMKFSVLNDSLTPTERDRLAGEVRYGSVLNQSFNQE
jgi:hypothetical protein